MHDWPARDACDDGGIAGLLRDRAPQGELILIATTGTSPHQLAWVANAISNLDALGLHHWLLLSETAQACQTLQAALAAGAGLTAACAFCGESSLQRLDLHPGPQEHPMRGQPSWQRTSFYDLLFLRWLVAERFVSRHVNVLSLDLDVHIVASPYPALHSPSFHNHSLLVEWDFNTYLNSGCMYFKNAQVGRGAHRILTGLISHLQASACGARRGVPRSRDTRCDASRRDQAPRRNVDQEVMQDLLCAAGGPRPQVLLGSDSRFTLSPTLQLRLLRGWSWYRGSPPRTAACHRL